MACPDGHAQRRLAPRRVAYERYMTIYTLPALTLCAALVISFLIAQRTAARFSLTRFIVQTVLIWIVTTLIGEAALFGWVIISLRSGTWGI